jgi:pilus assembly protein CpaC
MATELKTGTCPMIACGHNSQSKSIFMPAYRHLSSIVRFIFLLFGAMTLSSPGFSVARETIDLYVGEIEVMKTGKVDRVAIGNPKVASNTILPNGQLILMGDGAGETTMHIWLAEGEELDFDVIVRDHKQQANFHELNTLLKGIPGVQVTRIGDLMVIKGQVSSTDAEQLSKILGQFSGVLDLVTPRSQHEEIRTLLSAIPGTTIKEVGNQTVISGEVSKEYENMIKIVQGKYPGLMNLTRTQEAVAGKMIYMQVRIMEMRKSAQEKLGINWSNSLAGPSFQFGIEATRNGATILNDQNTSSVLKKADVSDLTSGTGYFGIATGVSSIISLLEASGDTVVLAEPRLSTRSGGKASFLAGGEIPMPLISSMGQTTVEFKKYGISLDIEPVVDDRGNILAHIETEVSMPDQSVAVQGIPGLFSRRTSADISMKARETLVIAGLLNETAQKSYDKVKWLGEMPILGPLFRSKDYQNEQSELVIFVTPQVYDASAAANQKGLETAEAMEQRYNEIISNDGLLE